MPGKRVNLYLDDDLVKQVKKIAIDKDTNLSRIINNLLEKYVEENKNRG